MAGGSDSDDGEEKKGDGGSSHDDDRFEYKIEGPQPAVKKIEEEINKYRQNPQNYYVEIDIDKAVKPEMINRIKTDCIQKYRLVDVKIVRT